MSEAPTRSWVKPRWMSNSSTQVQSKKTRQRERRRAKRKQNVFCIDWFKKGTCRRGDACEYKHSDEKIEFEKKRSEEEEEFILSMSGCLEAGAQFAVCPATGHERIDIIVDSGASTSAIPSSSVPSINIEPPPGKRVYTSASGHAVHEKGIQNLTCNFQNRDR